MTSILVTGGSGLIGSYTVKALVERGDEVSVLDLSPPRNPKTQWVLRDMWEKVNFVEGTICDDFPTLLKTCKDYNVEKIFHAAAIFRHAYELEHPYYSLHLASQSMLNVCEAARILGLGRIVFAGSNGEYDSLTVDHDPSPMEPTDARMFHPAIGAGPYSTGKKLSTIIGMCYWQTQGVDWVDTRLSRVWGLGAKKETAFGTTTMVENAVDGIPTNYLLGTEDQTRCQTYVKDVARGVLLALDVPSENLRQRVFNVGGPEETSDRDTARTIKEFIPDAVINLKGGGVNRRAFDSSAARKQLGYEPMYDLRAGINDHIEMYRAFKKTQA
jgi:nucleoside-diphosphate-sugar epimerase